MEMFLLSGQLFDHNSAQQENQCSGENSELNIYSHHCLRQSQAKHEKKISFMLSSETIIANIRQWLTNISLQLSVFTWVI